MRTQCNPRALAIVERYAPVREGYDPDGAPWFSGFDTATWGRIVRDPDFAELYDILCTDYPTFALLIQKIWAKRVGRLIPLVFNRTQHLAWNAIAHRIALRRPIFMVFFKARQLGISTMVNGLAHWHIWRLHDIEATLVAHEKPLVFSFVDRLRIFHEELPKVEPLLRSLRMQGKNARVPRDEMYYNETRSKISTVVAKNAEARGRSAPHYHLAEYAFYDAASDLLNAIMPQLPPVGSLARLQCSVIVESTPNGKNDFYDLWRMALKSEDWSAQFYPWFVQEDEYSLDPPQDYEPDEELAANAVRWAFTRRSIDGVGSISRAQLYWYEQTLETECHGDQDKMDREYPSDAETAFLLRSRSIFRDDMRYLQACTTDAALRAPAEFAKRGLDFAGPFARGRLQYESSDNPFGRTLPNLSTLRLKPIFEFSKSGDLCVWSPPQPEHEYVIGMDAAAGTHAGDYSVAEVLDTTIGAQVAELRYKRSPEDFTDDSVALGWWYNTALLYPEVNSIGVVTMKRAKKVWMYPRLGLQEKWDEVALKQNKYGMYTTEEQKMIMVSFFKHCVEHQYLAIASEQLLAEMSIFIETPGGDFRADNNGHDDCVMAMALALAVVRQSPKMLAGFTAQKQTVNPNAATAMIFDAPRPQLAFAPGSAPTSEQRVPPEIAALLEGRSILGVPANPIRGDGVELPW